VVGHTVPAGIFLPLVETVKRWDVGTAELLDGLELGENDLSEPFARFPLATYLGVIERARALTGEPGIGFGWGLQMKVSTFGALGFAAMTSATLGDAIAIAIQLAALGSTAEGLRLVVEGDVASLILDELADFGPVRDVVMTARLTGLWRIAEAVTGRKLDVTADVSFPEPAYYARFAGMVPPVRFGQPTTRALIPVAALAYPLIMANPLALRLATEQCVKELEALGERGRFLRSVRASLLDERGRLRSAPQVARVAGMSERTLRRRLAEEGVRFSTAVDEERRDRALVLLRDRALSLSEIADRLTYANVQSFERAFRRWTGVTPATYRREVGQGTSQANGVTRTLTPSSPEQK
jgi:AraC-like DNA-binding protein